MINTKLLLEDISDSVDKMYKQISDIEDLSLNNRNDDFQINEAYEYLEIYLHDIHIKVMYFLEAFGLKELLNNYKKEVEPHSFSNLKYYHDVGVLDSPVWGSMNNYVRLIRYVNTDSLNDELLKDINKKLDKFEDKRQHQRGKFKGIVAEDATEKYFEKNGYTVLSQNGTELDHLKIDLIAAKENEEIYIQVKSGNISNGEITKVINSIREIKEKQNDKVKKVKACIVAKTFNCNADLERITLEETSGLSIMFIHLYQIVEAIPVYKEILEK